MLDHISPSSEEGPSGLRQLLVTAALSNARGRHSPGLIPLHRDSPPQHRTQAERGRKRHLPSQSQGLPGALPEGCRTAARPQGGSKHLARRGPTHLSALRKLMESFLWLILSLLSLRQQPYVIPRSSPGAGPILPELLEAKPLRNVGDK